jgi:hypothetical protein
MKHARLLLLMLVAACGEAETASDAQVTPDAAPAEALVKAAPPTLEDLVLRLDSAGGYYWPKTRRQLELTNSALPAQDFRAHGREGVQRLIDCLTDTATTKTFHADESEFKYPRGVLCYELLQLLVDIDRSRQLPFDDQDLYVSMEKGEVRSELKRAQRAYQVIYNARAFRLRTIAPAG